MPLEQGGRADKFGNRYEIRCIIYELLKVIREDNYSVTIESLSDDEEGTDVLVCKKNGTIEHQQCKVRNASREYWTISDLNSRNILNAWLNQLKRDDNRNVAMVSPLGCSFLVDLHDRAMNTSEKTEMFYEWQIKGSDPKFVNAYEKFCGYMNLDYSKPEDIQKSVAYLKRIHFKQMSEAFFHESNKDMIKFLFSSDDKIVYNSLVTFVEEGDVLGKEITSLILRDYFKEQKIDLRLMDDDPRIFQLLEKLNTEFRSGFSSLQGTLIDRPEFKECIDVIKNEKNLIISGNAGYGKSGCVESILDYCDEQKIPYVALKLDRKVPHGNSEIWGKELGFSGAIPYSLHSVSKHEQAVLILDQLDALRWTQSNSIEALQVCMELITQVKQINITREKKISIVFVCRSYDLNYDNNIKALFKTGSLNNDGKNEWEKVNVQLLDEKTVIRIVGEPYSRLTSKNKKLLQVPSNLYIWTHLDNEEVCNDYTTTSSLIEKWFEQICRRGLELGIEERTILDTQNEIVNTMEKSGSLCVPKRTLECGENGVNFLVSSEMLVIQGTRVSFVHQSILDYFISKRMTRQYFNGEDIETIIGEKDKQTPSKRYQVQMFMQNLLEYDYEEFITAGKKLIECAKIRHYMKFVFYELLSQIEEPDEVIEDFIVEYCEHEIYGNYLLKNVIYGKPAYVKILMSKGFLLRWFEDERRRNTVFTILRSITPDLDSEGIQFIKDHAFKNEDDDKQFFGCFLYDITSGSDEFFNLRLQFYEKYPEWMSDLFIDIKKCFALCEKRIIKFIAFWLQNKNRIGKKSLHGFNEIFNNNGTFLVKEGQFILDELLGFVPRDDSKEICYSDWSCRYKYNKHTIERLVVEIIKKANQDIIAKDPNLFWKYYNPYMGKNYAVFNELILDAFKYLPTTYSNNVISYLCSDMDNNIFDETSNEENKLQLAGEVIKYHTMYCDDEYIEILEKAIQKYVSPRAVEWYKQRIDQNKQKGYRPVYWSFWGDLQLQLLHSIPQDRLSEKSKALLKVLQRRFEISPLRYNCADGRSGSVISPISKKVIGKCQWLQIMQNKKLQTRKHVRWREEKDGFVESSLEMYASDFQSVVSREPNEMIRLVLDNKDSIPACYVHSMFSGAAFSEKKDTISQETWEEMFKCFPCDMESQRATYFCIIIEKADIYEWSTDVLNQLNKIAINYNGIESQKQHFGEMDSEGLFSKALNLLRGEAARAIGHLLWEKKELIDTFKETIETLSSDKNPAVQMASMFALWPTYNIERNWAAEKILELYEMDIRMAAFRGSRNMFFLLYPKFIDRVLNVVQQCFDSKDKSLIELGGMSICEFYMLHDEFSSFFSDFEEFSELQTQAILKMAVIYLDKEDYREKAKAVIIKCKNTNHDVEFPLSRMFFDNLVDARQDSEFLIEIMNGKVNRKLVHAFVDFLEGNACSVKDYADVIITLCKSVLNLETEEIAKNWGIENNISKLIIALYDECANAKNQRDKTIAEKCLDLWDIMFEKQIGQTRRLSRELMER